MLACARPWWAVLRRLEGNPSAMERPTERPQLHSGETLLSWRIGVLVCLTLHAVTATYFGHQVSNILDTGHPRRSTPLSRLESNGLGAMHYRASPAC